MKLILNGNVNVYYIQTLCMIFFPGEKFGAAEATREDAPVLSLDLTETAEGVEAFVEVTANGKSASARKLQPLSEDGDRDKTLKLAVGAAVIAACGELMGYRPS